jgi:signal peptidase I
MSQPSTTPAPPLSNVRETLESLIIAFVLALIFRAFIVEPFVIPTGSMAPTLLGAHTHYVCPDCGYAFDVNYSSPRNDDVIYSPTVLDFDVHCPNCGFLVAPRGPANPNVPIPDPRSVQSVDYGDRILVLKYAYLIAQPQRWDVVVFKAPADPDKYHYTQNYIKRLVGLPGEKLQVLDGGLYVSQDHGATWTIQTRPRVVQDALWRIVYDNDYYPQQLQRSQGGVRELPWKQPWQIEAGSGWNLGKDASDGRVFQFDNSSGFGTIQFNPTAVQTGQTLTDYLAYDLGANADNNRRPGPEGEGSPDDRQRNPVSDLKLSLTYCRADKGGGPLRMELKKLEDTFVAEITPTTASIFHDSPAGRKLIGQPVPFDGAAGHSHVIDFINVDYKVTLRIDGVDVITSTPQDYAPDVNRLLAAWHENTRLPSPSVSISAINQASTISHLSLWRNIYYTNDTRRQPGLFWGTPGNPVQLGTDEFFVMGDNSLISADARYWDRRIEIPEEDLDVDAGRVPARFMLGKAFFVYWPAGQRIFGPNGYAIIPDFGDMRFIH